MAQPNPKPRFNEYGQPLEKLVDAREERLGNRPVNQVQRALILRKLASMYDLVLRRGFYGAVTLNFEVQDGIIEQQVKTTILQQHRE